MGATSRKMGKVRCGDVHSVLGTLRRRGHWADSDGNRTLRDISSAFLFVFKSI